MHVLFFRAPYSAAGTSAYSDLSDANTELNVNPAVQTYGEKDGQNPPNAFKQRMPASTRLSVYRNGPAVEASQSASLTTAFGLSHWSDRSVTSDPNLPFFRTSQRAIVTILANVAGL